MEPIPSDPLRLLWLGLGFLFVGLGFVGVVVPGMPSTVFFIISAYFFSRSNKRFLNWVLNLPKVGPAVRDYRAGLGMPRRAKTIVVTIIGAMVLLAVLFAIKSVAVKLVVLAVGAVGMWFVGLRVPTKERVLAERANR
jgi:hypothetical protein